LLAQQHTADVLLDVAAARCVVEAGRRYRGQIPDQALEAIVSLFCERLLIALEAMHAPASVAANEDEGACLPNPNARAESGCYTNPGGGSFMCRLAKTTAFGLLP